MDARALSVGSLHTLMTKVGLGDAEDHMVVVSVTLFVTLLCACIVMGHLVEEFQWISESVTAITLVSSSLAATVLDMLQLLSYIAHHSEVQ